MIMEQQLFGSQGPNALLLTHAVLIVKKAKLVKLVRSTGLSLKGEGHDSLISLAFITRPPVTVWPTSSAEQTTVWFSAAVVSFCPHPKDWGSCWGPHACHASSLTHTVVNKMVLLFLKNCFLKIISITSELGNICAKTPAKLQKNTVAWGRHHKAILDSTGRY